MAPIRALKNESSSLLLWLRTARRWNDSIHAQVLNHLTVMIERMRRGKTCQAEPSHFRAERAFNLVELVLCGYRRKSLVQVGKRVLRELHDVGFSFDGIGPVLPTGIHRRLLSQNTGTECIVACGHVLYLLGKRTHALEFPVAGRERILIFRHCFGGRDEVMFGNG